MTKQVKNEHTISKEVQTEASEEVTQDATRTKKPLYSPASWKNVVTVYKCETCGHCANLEDDMILHVITHPKLSASGRMELFERLIKEKK